MRASWTRSTSIARTDSHTPVSAIGSASIVKPGLTPVPSTATRARRASASIFRATAACAFTGYASSSVVETIGTFCFRTASNSGTTFLIEELVHSTATSGLTAFSVFVMSAVTGTRSFLPTPQTSPTSRPIFAGSMSTAPTSVKPFRAASCLTTPAPMGPRPMLTTLMDTRALLPEKRPMLAFRPIDHGAPTPRSAALPRAPTRPGRHGWRRTLSAWASSPVSCATTLVAALPSGGAARRPPAHDWQWERVLEAQDTLVDPVFRTHSGSGVGVPPTVVHRRCRGDRSLDDSDGRCCIRARSCSGCFSLGGMLDRLARGRPIRTAAFFAACGVYFFRFLRLALPVAVIYWVFHHWLMAALADFAIAGRTPGTSS